MNQLNRNAQSRGVRSRDDNGGTTEIGRKPNWALIACAGLTLMVTVFDINVIGFMLTGKERIASYLILAICCVSYVGFRFRFVASLGLPGVAFVSAVVGYTLLSSFVRISADASPETIFELVYWNRMAGTVVAIVLAAAVGTYYAAQRLGADKTLLLVYCILQLQVVSVLLSPLYADQMMAGMTKMQKRAYLIEGRLSGFLANPNEAGFLMAVTAAIGFACLQSKSLTMKGPVVTGIAAAAVACLMTFSRSSWLMFFGVCLSQLFYSSVIKQKSIFAGVGLLAVGLIWFVTSGVNQFGFSDSQQRRLGSITKIVQGTADHGDTGTRFLAISKGLRAWSENPAFGLGIGNNTDPHNHFVLVLMEGGVFSLMMYVSALVIWGWFCWRCDIPIVRTAAMGFFLVYLANNMVDHGTPTKNYTGAMLGVTFGLLAAATAAKKKNRKKRRRAVINAPPIPALAEAAASRL